MSARIVVAITTALAVFAVQAGDITLRWATPVTTENCYPSGPLDNLAGYRLYERVAEVADPESVEHTISGKVPGTYLYTVAAYDNQGSESQISESVSIEIETFLTVGGPVYNVLKRDNRFVLLVVGNVPAGVTCDPEQQVNGRYAVPVSEVQWTGTVRPVVVLADCR